MGEVNESVYLPLDKAINYLEENKLYEIINKVNEIQKKHQGTRQSRNIRKGIIVDELEKIGKFKDFCELYWKNGFSETGIRAIRKYKSHLSFLGELNEIDEENTEGSYDQKCKENISYEESSFAYEDDLRDYLANNLNIIESGLTLFIDEKGIEGVEYSVDDNNKRIDILALDKNKKPVVIELKVSKGYERVIGQCQYYKNRIKKILKVEEVRVIIIAREITQHLQTAAIDLPSIELFEYELNIKLNKINPE